MLAKFGPLGKTKRALVVVLTDHRNPLVTLAIIVYRGHIGISFSRDPPEKEKTL